MDMDPQKRRRNVQLQGLLLPIYDPSLCSSDFMTGEDGGAHSCYWGNNNDLGTACTGGVTPPELRRRNFLGYAALENINGVSNSSTSSVSNLIYMTVPSSTTAFHYNSFKFFNHVCPPADAGTVSATVNDLSRNSAPLDPVTGYDFVLNGSRFLGPTLQLLREICDVGSADTVMMDPSMANIAKNADEDSQQSCNFGSLRRRLMLLLIEEYKRYKQCCHQIHEVVASFESVAGVENAAPFAIKDVKEMTKRFYQLRNLISDQLQLFLFDPHDGHNVVAQGKYIAPQRSDTSSATGELISGSPKGHPPHAIIILRAWFFNHFLQPYPTDIDRLILAMQTGLSESQVSTWFINTRVRLWKPLVEELRMLETRQAQKSSHEEVMSNVHDRESNQLIHRGSNTTVPLSSLKTPTPVQRIQDNIMSLKRARNESTAAEKNALLMDSNCENLSAFPQMGLGVSSGGANGGIWGLQQINSASSTRLTDPFPVSAGRSLGPVDPNGEELFAGGWY